MKKLYALAAALFIGGVAVAQNDVSFAVDMNNYSGTFTTVYVSGDFNSWSGNSNALSEIMTVFGQGQSLLRPIL